MNTLETDLTWPAAPPNPVLNSGNAHVWAAPLDVPMAAVAALAQTLSIDEKERAARFRFEHLRNRYIVGRGTLRRILATYLDVSPGAIEFTFSDLGKPTLANPDVPELHFNLAHSDCLAVCAVTRCGIVGVDVERRRAVDDMDHLVARFFSEREHKRFAALPDQVRPTAFFNLWTRKEAMLKATGAGIGGGLNRVEVTFLENEPAQVLAVPPAWPPPESWSLHSFSPAPDFVGAVAVLAERVRLECWKA